MTFILQCANCTDEDFIDFWSKRYDEGKYSDSVYIENVNENELLNENNIKPLLEWKNGGNLSTKKFGIINKIIANLDKINDFRKLGKIDSKSEIAFYQLVSKIIKTGIVWRIFLFNIARPKDYPIFDQHVNRAYWFLKYGEVAEPPKTYMHYKYYKQFFLELVKRTNKSYREIDRALMAFGQFLKSQFYAK